ncbi:MotA/TolQ/ExbB proton channel family protein [Brevundimonas sp.]|uniref:MotA/TolQ/ExbB proton channel family protein n=1 Tax=Brevundimonas sp. TaxID=1871086 RepID=UPI003F713385
MRSPFSRLVAGLMLASIPIAAVAAPRITIASVFTDADETMKFLMIALIAASLAAVIVTGLKLASGRRLNGGSAFISALRLGGPLIGLVGAAFILLMGLISIANFGGPVPMPVLAPGFAEAALLFLLGLIAGVVGVVCHWIIESRIDRAVLQS